MTKLFTFLVLILSSQTALAQHIRAIDFIQKSYCKDLECFNEYILRSGYSLSGSKNEVGYNVYKYSKDGNSGRSNAIMYMIASTKSYSSVTLTTTDKEYYLELLDEVREQGYVVKSSGTSSDNISTYYSSKTDPHIIITTTVRIANSETIYSICFVNDLK